MFGFINIYKPKGYTSHDIVAILRKITNIKQIGHTGTLDPFAEGVLPVCIGKATRLIEYLDDDKAYIGTVKFGYSTTTYDIEGEPIKYSDKKINADEVSAALKNFTGDINQIPPIYSAIKVNGKKLYEYARRGEHIEIKSRPVHIKNIILRNFDEQNQTAEIYIECSKGTYIRSIANDLGETLGTFAHLIKLVRVKSGLFTIEQSVKPDTLHDVHTVENYLIAPLEYLKYPQYVLSKDEAQKVSHGMPLAANVNDGLLLLVENNRLVAIGNCQNSLIKCCKVF